MLQSPALKYARPYYMPKWMPDANTVLWFPGQDDAYSTTIRDRSGEGNNGTLDAPTWTRHGKGLWYTDHEGDDDIITVTDAPELSALGAMTLLTWFKADAAGEIHGLISKDTGADANREWVFYIPNTNKLTLLLYSAVSGTDYLTAAGTADPSTDGLWHLLAVTFDGVNATGHVLFYIDGASDAVSSETKYAGGYTAHDGTGDVEIGRYAANDVTCADGGFALERIITRAMSATEIAGIYNNERSLLGV